MALPAPEEITKVEPASPAAAEITPPILGFPEKFELAYRYGENRLAKDVEMSAKKVNALPDKTDCQYICFHGSVGLPPSNLLTFCQH